MFSSIGGAVTSSNCGNEKSRHTDNFYEKKIDVVLRSSMKMSQICNDDYA
uniref:Uncharacterized protein n=1 Tax=Arion vulgaris TaxID=1028688 RepID=A0A0B7AVC8_9EUPU